MTNLQERSLTSIFFVLTLVGSIYLNEFSSAILFLVIIYLCQREFYNFFKGSKISVQKNIGILGGLSYYGLSVLASMAQLEQKTLLLIIPLTFILFIIELYRKKEEPLANIAYTLLGIIYISVPITLMHQLAYFDSYSFGNSYNSSLLLAYFFILWANDTGAYFSGRFLGSRKLFPRISPKKTWEGAIGGGVLGLGVGYICFSLFDNLDLTICLGMAIIIVLFGSLGDLVESLFKRSLNIKDSSNILPGHGGVLDRFDGIFISAPMVYTFLHLLAF